MSRKKSLNAGWCSHENSNSWHLSDWILWICPTHLETGKRAMTIREIGWIRGIPQPIVSFGTARVSRNVDLIANGGGIGGRRCAVTPKPDAPLDALVSFLYDCVILQLLFLRRNAALAGPIHIAPVHIKYIGTALLLLLNAINTSAAEKIFYMH